MYLVSPVSLVFVPSLFPVACSVPYLRYSQTQAPGEMVNCPSPNESLISEIELIPETTPREMTPENLEDYSLEPLLKSHPGHL
ncbi:hypothetical protein DPEC_G00186990 [Dallia pectoralis]|uniref:Uncharacterized protein n=1 Tax=Dallia pectoralis TaxID=75939 RepID=A0ACC2GBX8_DALPE|nr:hypothetical protein DPEC_G00186990 [Dallia pectoralis]